MYRIKILNYVYDNFVDTYISPKCSRSPCAFAHDKKLIEKKNPWEEKKNDRDLLTFEWVYNFSKLYNKDNLMV